VKNRSPSRGRGTGILIIGVLLLLIAVAAWFAPYVYGELAVWLEPHVIVDSAPAELAKGRMVDDYFAVEDLGDGTFAIGEPRYYQQNYSYLIVGEKRAILFDSGSGTRDISGVVANLTKLPVTVIVSHLHYDHLGGIGPFEHVGMIDLPETRADVSGGIFRPGHYEYMGFFDGRAAPSIRVGEWLAPGAVIDLGGRGLKVYAWSYTEFGGAIRCHESSAIHRRLHLSDDPLCLPAGCEPVCVSGDGEDAARDVA
jgi:hydroxyacylglutathione hydrolase